MIRVQEIERKLIGERIRSMRDISGFSRGAEYSNAVLMTAKAAVNLRLRRIPLMMMGIET
jgi:hypothetical protein